MTTYKVTGYFQGVVYAQYSKGMLSMLLADISEPATLLDRPNGWDMFPLKESDLLSCTEMFKAVELKPKTVADKVALFCLKYKQHKGQPYRAMKEEKANLKTVTVNEQLLNTYFTNINYPLSQTKSMADYVRHYNTVRDLSANGKSTKAPSFPDRPDSDYEKTLSPEKLSAYRMHLVTLGWKKVDGLWQQTKQP